MCDNCPDVVSVTLDEGCKVVGGEVDAKPATPSNDSKSTGGEQ